MFNNKVLSKLLNLLLTFSWTFVDLLIMLLSTAMALRFNQVACRLRAVADAKVKKNVLLKKILVKIYWNSTTSHFFLLGKQYF